MKKSAFSITFQIIAYLVLILFAIMSILPFWTMFMNATRSTVEIQQQGLSLLPSDHLMENINYINARGSFQPMTGLKNSMIISIGATVLATYFSVL
ncbi:MAG: carbohydrate ABC transporter permease, partial [Oscillospiraceae bacterium]|nr:carbohydrate ABC transporter permease [Oscillospiraceae bacterium]